MLSFILSQPRSGSTVLSAILDRIKGVVVMPESSFPQVLGEISSEERRSKRWLAALYRGSTFPSLPEPPTPLSIDDAERCMEGSDAEILLALGKALTVKLGKDSSQVTHVIWKTTRTIGLHKGPVLTGGRFVILRRHLHNIFDSQFRVDFGMRNRNPWRFAVFTQSYENAFEHLPKTARFELNYATIPEDLQRLLDFLGIEERLEWPQGKSSIELVSETASWLTQATASFQNTDQEKRAKLAPQLKGRLDIALQFTRPLRPLMGPVRRHYDLKSLADIREEARGQLRKADYEQIF